VPAGKELFVLSSKLFGVKMQFLQLEFSLKSDAEGAFFPLKEKVLYTTSLAASERAKMTHANASKIKTYEKNKHPFIYTLLIYNFYLRHGV
jgi:hypothetical protein